MSRLTNSIKVQGEHRLHSLNMFPYFHYTSPKYQIIAYSISSIAVNVEMWLDDKDLQHCLGYLFLHSDVHGILFIYYEIRTQGTI